MSTKMAQTGDNEEEWAVRVDGKIVNTFDNVKDAREIAWINHHLGSDVALVDPEGVEHTP